MVEVKGVAQVSLPESEEESSVVKQGNVLSEGDFLEVNEGGQVTLLLSNGTLLTVDEKTGMTIGRFDQVPFDLDGAEVEILQQSQVHPMWKLISILVPLL